ncbi:glycosyl transferase family 2 [Methylocella silvestris BL2]|uniref:Glycosyl transferase family 2 n=1 Tax=Methylocella silvestris (strain DSM 15510 / CIP 108128 / LMG 27833 / NCIMB 13906 / BL2) TaxID=395965 RepID=B8ERT9_METSB|nr:glycosyltransferase [Methylocella silvestris]ACK51637.1 glycosyl transferase family 2 [Methylocella silvestris BL2]
MPLKIKNLRALPYLAELIACSRIFDEDWYRKEYPAFEMGELGPIMHYLVEGVFEGARPHLLFDPDWYRTVASCKAANPLIDYIKSGAAAGFDPSPYFSSAYYRKSAGALRGLTPLGHFIAYGLPCNATPTPLFDRDWYLAHNPDVMRAGFDPFLHFVASGARDGRSPGPLFDAPWYRMKNPGVRDAGVEPLRHYLSRGAAEGRRPHDGFDPVFYVAQAPHASVTLEQALADYAEQGRANWRSADAALPPPGSPVAVFDDFPWRRSATSEHPHAPFSVLIIDVAGPPPATADLCAALKQAPQVDLYVVANTPDAAMQEGVAMLDLSQPNLAAFESGVVLDRLLRALKFRDSGALVIEANYAAASLSSLCAELALAHHQVDAAAPLTTAGWAELLRRKIGYRETPRPTISTIIPNYNHGRYLDERIGSILAQTLPPDEIIFLDDASDDESLAIAQLWQAKSRVPFTIIAAEANSGSPFKQWAKGVLEARCDLVSIAESDDSSAPRFLERMVASFRNPNVVLAYSDSETIGTEGETLASSCRFYTDTLDETKWRSGYVEDGAREIATTLAVKNTIPNVSAVLFQRAALCGVLETIQGFRYCGDWAAYVACLRQGAIAFCPEALNRRRQDPGSVTQDGERATLAVQEALAIKRSILQDIACADPIFWLSLAQTIFEYEGRSAALLPGRPAFTANKDLTRSLDDMSDIIAKRRSFYAEQKQEVAHFLRNLADCDVTLDRAGRQALVARVIVELRTLAKDFG